MSCSNKILPNQFLSSVFVGKQGEQGPQGPPGTNSTGVTVAFDNSAANVGAEVEELASAPNYSFAVFNAKPSDWKEVDAGGIVTKPTVTASQAVARMRQERIWREVTSTSSTTTTKYYAKIQCQGLLEIDSGLTATEVTLVTAPFKPLVEQTFCIPIKGTGDFVNIRIDTDGKLYLFPGSGLTLPTPSSIIIDISNITFDSEVV